MIVDKEWMQKRFAEFNDSYFEGKLPTPVFGLSRSKTRLGTLSYKYNRRMFRMVKTDFTLRLTTAFVMTERQAENILLHEMIHLCIASMGLPDTSAHGVTFRKMMNVLNKEYGWEVTVSTRLKDYTPVSKPKPRERLVLLLRHKQAGYIVTVVNAKYRSAIERILDKARDISEHHWLISSDEYFADFPQVRSLRGRRVTREEYERIKEAGSNVHALPL